MADEIIGSLGVQIEADASDLPGQYDAAVRASEDAAERIAGAFESLVGIGEALAITEGLKEFGQEALNAYGTVQSVTIGLTQLTKSASEANDIIEQVKTLAATEPFAFPEIAPTVQKMVALGVSAEQIPTVMQAAADVAAATGNSFQQVANSIDRMSLSGTVSARSLVQLGISTKDLGDVMGVTEGEVKAAFLAMDQSQRIDILTAALAKFAGSAEAQAQGIAGEWQIFQNKFEEVMVGVGQALAPAVGALLDFGTDVLHTAQEAIDAFNALPEPVKQAASAFGLVVASIAPLTVAAGTLGLGIVGIQAAIAPLNELLVSLGLRSGEAAIAQEAQATAAKDLAVAEGEAAIASGEAGAAAGLAAEGGITAMGAAANVAGAGIAALVGFKLGEWAYTQIPGVQQLADDLNTTAMIVIPGYQAALEKLTKGHFFTGADEEGLSEAIIHLQEQLKTLNVTVDQGTMSDEKYYDALVKARAAHKDLDTSVSGTQAAVDALVKKQDELTATLTKAQAVLANVTQQFNDGDVSAGVYQSAIDGVTKAQDALNKLNPQFADSLAGVTQAYNKQQSAITALQNTVLALMSAQDGSVGKAVELTTAEEKLAAAYETQDKAVQKAFDSTHAFVGPLTEAAEAANKAAGAMTSYEVAAEALVQHQRDLNLSVQTTKGVLDALTASTDTSQEHTAATVTGLENYATALRNAGGDMNRMMTVTVGGVVQIGTLAEIIKHAKDNMADFHTTTVTVPEVLDKVQQAALGLLTGVDYLNTGVQAHVDLLTNKAVPIYHALHEVVLTAKQDNALLQASVNDVGDSMKATVDNASRFASTVNDVSNNMSGAVDNASRFASGLDAVTGKAYAAGDGMAALTQRIKDQKNSWDDISAAIAKAGGAAQDSWGTITGLTMSAMTYMGWVGNIAKGLIAGLSAGPGVADQVDAFFHAQGYQGSLEQGYTKLTAEQTAYIAAVDASAKKTDQYRQQLIDAGVAVGDVTNVLVDLENKSAQTSISLSKEISDYISQMKNHATATASAATATAALANATSGNATALGTKTTATTTATAATSSLATATTSLVTAAAAAVNALNSSSITTTDALGNVTTAYTTTTNAAQQFVDGLGNVYNSYNALVNAIKMNPLLAGPAQSTSVNTQVMGGASSFTPGPIRPEGGTTAGVNALPNVLATLPNGTVVTGSPGQTLQDALRLLFPGGASGGMSVSGPSQPAIVPSGSGFGSSPALAGGGVNLVMNYPSFNSQGQAQQTMNQMVTLLRTVVGQKL